MSTYEVSRARGDQESRSIREGIEQAASHDTGSWEFGHYIERYDGPLDNGHMPRETSEEDWTPLIYKAQDLEDAEDMHAMHRLDTPLTSPFRNPRIVRRAVSPWEVFS